MPPAEVVVYDFDGTLVEGDIGAAFIHHLLRGSGSAGVARHCTGEAKLRALVEEGFPPPYVRAISDAAIDLPLLRAAREAVLVNASARCRTIVRQALGARLVDADLTALPLP